MQVANPVRLAAYIKKTQSWRFGSFVFYGWGKFVLDCFADDGLLKIINPAKFSRIYYLPQPYKMKYFSNYNIINIL